MKSITCVKYPIPHRRAFRLFLDGKVVRSSFDKLRMSGRRLKKHSGVVR